MRLEGIATRLIGLMFKTEGRLSRTGRLAGRSPIRALALNRRGSLRAGERRDATGASGLRDLLWPPPPPRASAVDPRRGGRHRRGELRLGGDRRYRCAGARRRGLPRIPGRGVGRSAGCRSTPRSTPATPCAKHGRCGFDTMEAFQLHQLRGARIVHGGGFGCVPMFDAAGTRRHRRSVRAAHRAQRTPPWRVRAVPAWRRRLGARGSRAGRRVAVRSTQPAAVGAAPGTPIAVAARYRPGHAALDVGGDW